LDAWVGRYLSADRQDLSGFTIGSFENQSTLESDAGML